MFSNQGFLLLLLASSISAFESAEYIPQALNLRAVTSGGWPLNNPTCPVNNQLCDYAGFCCPNSLECVHIGTGNHCCPKGISCQAAYALSPQCADDSWALWNVTTSVKGQGYFCCLPGQIGTNVGTCVTGNTPVVPTLSAQLVSSATGVAAAGSSSVSSAVSSSATRTVSSVISAATTTTAAGGASVTSSQPSAQASKSGAMKSVAIGRITFQGVLAGLTFIFLRALL